MSRFLTLSFVVLALLMPTGAAAADFAGDGPVTGFFGASATVNSPGSPYPSKAIVSGMPGLVTDVNLTLKLNTSGGASFVQYDLLLVSPDGLAAMLISDCDASSYPGSSTIQVSFDQASPLEVPNNEAPIVPSVNGSSIVRPRNCEGPPTEADFFPELSPFLEKPADLGRFNGTQPNGEWKLYIGGVGPSGNFLYITEWTLHLSSAVPVDTTPPQFSRRTVSARTIGFDLSEAASVSYRFERASRGVKVGKRCLAKSRTRRGKGCTRHKLLPGAITRSATAGVNTYTWNGRLGGRRLAAGKYRVTATATDAAGNSSSPARFNVTLKKPGRK